MTDQTLSTREMTFEEFTRLYEGKRYEYINGRAVPMDEEIVLDNGETTVTPTRFGHGAVVGRLTIMLGNFVLANDLGEVVGAETGFLMAQEPPQMRAADVAFVPKARLKEMRADQWMPFPPDLAVEVVSEYDKARDIRSKARAYMDHGTRLLWIVYPDTREVEVWQPDQTMRLLTASDTLDGADVLPGFSLPLATLFSALDALGGE